MSGSSVLPPRCLRQRDRAVGATGVEVLNLEAFTSTLKARVLSEKWRREYNEQRPHGALGYWTPQQVLEQALGTGTLQTSKLTAALAQAYGSPQTSCADRAPGTWCG